MVIRALLFGAALVTACGASRRSDLRPEAAAGSDAGASAGADAGGTTPTRTIAVYQEAVSRALCELEVRCGSMSRVERCLEFRNGMRVNDTLRPFEEVAYDRYFAGQDLVGYLDEEYVLADPAILDACLSAIASAQCDRVTFGPPECQHVLLPRAPRAEGEPCEPPSPFFQPLPCDAGLQCTDGVCAPQRERLAEGAPCSAWDDCRPGLLCRTVDAETSRCERAPRVGEACGEYWECADGGCVNERCVPFAGFGEPCGNDAQCQYDLSCSSSGTCVASAGSTGVPCGRGQGQCLLWCNFVTPHSLDGTCGTANPAGPTPCASYADDPGEWCPSGTYMDESDDGGVRSCNCLPAATAR